MNKYFQIKRIAIAICWAVVLCPSSGFSPPTGTGPREVGDYFPRGIDDESSESPRFHVRSMEQQKLDPKKALSIDQYKSQLLANTFDYSSNDQIAGLYSHRTNSFFVNEGHTRLAAALEIAKDTGNWSHFKRLVKYGYWHKTDSASFKHYPLPMRSTWSNFFQCRRTLGMVASPDGHY